MLQKFRFVPMGLLLFSLLITFSIAAQPDATITIHKDLRSGLPSAVNAPVFLSVDEADKLFYPNEPLIVLTVSGETHAYSLWQLDKHEVVNDMIAEIPLAITWYPFSNTAAVYEGTVDNASHTFKSVGFLCQNSRVLEDTESASLWSQVSGECIKGELKGAKLTSYPASFMTFADFVKIYPAGLLLSKEELGNAGHTFDGYTGDMDRQLSFNDDESFKKLKSHDMIYGLTFGDQQLAVAGEFLKKSGQILLDKNDPPIYLSYYKKGERVAAFSLAGVAPELVNKISNMYDKITTTDGSHSWHGVTGKLIKGDGSDLTPVTIVPTYWYAWYGFYPDTKLMK